LTDFHNSFTDVLNWKLAMKLLIKIHLTSNVLLQYLVKC